MPAIIPDQGISAKGLLTVSAWTLMLLISDLPDILIVSAGYKAPEWLYPGKIGVLVLFPGLCFLWKAVRPLWKYAFILLVFYLSFAFSEWFRNIAWWKDLFAGTNTSFTFAYIESFIRDTGIALIVIAALWLVQKDRRKFFLLKGDLSAPVEPVRWMGIRSGESWRKFGWIFSVCAGAFVFFPTLFSIQPSAEMVMKAVHLLPAVFLFAAINAFNEEIYFRVSVLSTLNGLIGKTHLLLITSVFFGLAHYLHGTPPGIIGFLMTGFLAWLMGKSILETKGLGWAWFIHFVPDAVIFFSYALLW